MTTLEIIRARIVDHFSWNGNEIEITNYAVRKCLSIIDKYAEQEPTTRQSCENCKILELLVDMEISTICEDNDNNFEYCEQNCNFKAPTKECYLQWAEHKRKAVSK